MTDFEGFVEGPSDFEDLCKGECGLGALMRQATLRPGQGEGRDLATGREELVRQRRLGEELLVRLVQAE